MYTFLLGVLLLCVFIAVNLLLLPVAYVKTTIHKALIFKSSRESLAGRNLLVFGLLGIPLLLGAQFTDVYYFVIHLYQSRQQ